MSNDYIANEVQKIIDSKSRPENFAFAAAWLIAHFKGLNVKVFDVVGVSTLSDYVVLGSCSNTTQSNSLSKAIEKSFANNGLKPKSVEGSEDGQWVLLDFGDIIVHLFQDEMRDVYDLDKILLKAKPLEIPNEYYHGPETEQKNDKLKTEDYF